VGNVLGKLVRAFSGGVQGRVRISSSKVGCQSRALVMHLEINRTHEYMKHLYYLRQWNEVIIEGDYEIGRSVRLCVCLSVCVHELAEIMHSNERLLVMCCNHG